jgi:hypothetical protein
MRAGWLVIVLSVIIEKYIPRKRNDAEEKQAPPWLYP